MPVTTATVCTWPEAEAAVRQLADGLPVYWGTGYPIEHPHVVAYTMDAWSGEGVGYNVAVYAHGNLGYAHGDQCSGRCGTAYHTVYVNPGRDS